MLIRKIARPMLASVYIADGADALINAPSRKRETEVVLDKIRGLLPSQYASYVPNDPELVARGVGATKIGAGSLLALGKAPRLSAATLALLQVGTIVGRHNFWEAENEEEKTSRRNGFLTSVALLGGLTITSVDTEGRPDLAWRAKQALPSTNETKNAAQQAGEWIGDKSQQATAAVSDYVDEHKDEWKDAATQAADTAGNLYNQAVSAGQDAVQTVRKEAPKWANKAEKTSRQALDELQDNAQTAGKRTVKAANKAQKKADKALQKADKKTGRAFNRASNKAERLQKKADKAVSKAVRQAERKLK